MPTTSLTSHGCRRPHWRIRRRLVGPRSAISSLDLVGLRALHSIEYLRPAALGDELVIETRVADMRKATSTRVYRIFRPSDGKLLAKARTLWAFVNYATGKPTRIPPEIAGAFPLSP